MSSDGARLITAASDGDKKVVKKFLKDGVDVNSRYYSHHQRAMATDQDSLTTLAPGTAQARR